MKKSVERSQGDASAAEPAPPHKPAARQRLSDHLYGQILEQIMTGALRVGDRLPSEHEIGQQYHMSRPVVREALLRLRADGLVTAHQGMGTFVTHQPELRLKTFDDAGNVAFYLRAQELRQAIEGDAARLAAARRSKSQLKAIEAAHQAFAEQAHQRGPVPDADLAFHMAIVRASGNELYESVLYSVMEPVQGFMRLALNLTRTGSQQRVLSVIGEHEAIVQAIRSQDGEQARVAMQFHLAQARRRLVGQSERQVD